ncbi:MAG: SDR family NAD(P)-dependent oxidoreductase, partial [Candidatus Bathyarchaeia archaeon]
MDKLLDGRAKYFPKDVRHQEVIIMKLKDKVAIITGSASGIGRASALLFAKEGARVILADINQSGGDETVKEVRENGGEASFVKADVTKHDQARTIIKSTSDNYQSLNILFNNAGIEGKMAELTEQSE